MIKMLKINNEHYSEKIKAGCPKCGNAPQNMEYWNRGPIVRIICRQCGFVCNDTEAFENGFKDFFEYWNQLKLR